MFDVLNSRYIAALDHAIDICQNLTEFGIEDPREVVNLRMATVSLSRLFGNKERSMQLRKLWIRGDISQEVLNAIIENCLALDVLQIYSCGALNDEHLIEWARRGAKPIKFAFIHCNGITDRGVIPILKNSAARLNTFHPYSMRGSKLTELTWITCFEHCRYARNIIGYPEGVTDACLSKCFYRLCGFHPD